ncbi:hypothetical protein AMECASPLE_020311 [Ameca splendens]|uniref:Uncharacterized protein n=1 Tax=Ameca splendens TaxID=208324 RepID=A0ABV0XGA1_9TELE
MGKCTIINPDAHFTKNKVREGKSLTKIKPNKEPMSLASIECPCHCCSSCATVGSLNSLSGGLQIWVELSFCVTRASQQTNRCPPPDFRSSVSQSVTASHRSTTRGSFPLF